MERDATTELLDHFRGVEINARAGPVLPVAIIVAHADDEVLGAGAQLRKLHRASFVHVTDGSPRNPCDAVRLGFKSRKAYADARSQELLTALTLAGINPTQSHQLGFVDQEGSFNLPQMTLAIMKRIRELRPEAILTHPYEGGHPDHDATAFAVHAACRLLKKQGDTSPAIIEMAFYHNRGGTMATSSFLPGGAGVVTTIELSEPERAFKRRLMDCHVTQQMTLKVFSVGIECFRSAPAYNFMQPPHEGKLHYELFDWGMSGGPWRKLARQALSTLGLEEHP
jgi:N-acetylglucosamine malate deacetylase 2